MDYDFLKAALLSHLPADEEALRQMPQEQQDILRGALLEMLEAIEEAADVRDIALSA